MVAATDDAAATTRSANFDSEDDQASGARVGCGCYLAALLAASLVVSGVTICLWSSMGMGQVAIDWLQANDWLWYPATAAWCSILALLLALDFFRPAHLPGMSMRLWETDYYLGRALLGLGLSCFWLACLFTAREFPSVPLVMTIVLGPFVMAAIRYRMSEEAPSKPEDEGQAIGQASTFAAKLQKIQEIAGQEADSQRFYTAAMLAFLAAALASLATWLAWTVSGGRYPDGLAQTEDCQDGWFAPVECAERFTYRGASYTGCTRAKSPGQPWCSHSEEFASAWSNCLACEASQVEIWLDADNVSSSCSWGSTLRSAFRGGLEATEEECKGHCSFEPLCSYSVYYNDTGCTEDDCLADGAPWTRCRLAASCEGGKPSSSNGSYVVFEKSQELQDVISASTKDELYIIWSAPLVVVVSNLVFAAFAGARVYFHNSYVSTSSHVAMDFDSMEGGTHGDARVRARMEQQQQKAMQQLSVFVKLVVCAFLFVITLFWITGQLLYADSQVAMMVMGLMASFFLVFIFFMAMSLRRVVTHLWDWLAGLPVWRTVGAAMRSDWLKAFVFCCALPVLPIAVLLSMLNQSVRRLRGIHRLVPASTSGDNNNQGRGGGGGGEPGTEDKALPPVDPQKLWVTLRMHELIVHARRCNKLSIFAKCYFFCTIMFLYTLFPLVLNVFLAWFNQALLELGLEFHWIVLITFCVGVAAFLLPPVPGLTIYLFGGLMMSSTCPDGFWAGAVINIGMGWVLKLVACAIQQKVIGGLLGKSLWVRRTCGVHKVAIRCIEAELRRPGWTIGKVAILCGGPDWPVSVLAGILNLSLFQCELGTVPIIFFIIPCSLSGSFYMKRGVTEVWTRSGNLMLVASVMISGILWVVAGWAIQNQLENNQEELTRPLPQNVDLEWLDFKADELRKKVQISWENVPAVVRYMYGAGALIHILCCHAFYWGYSFLFHAFEVNDPIKRLKSWYGEEGVVTFNGCLALGTYFLAWLCVVVFRLWTRAKTKGPMLKASAQLDTLEKAWKEDWLEKAKTWKFEEATAAKPNEPAKVADGSGGGTGVLATETRREASPRLATI